MDNNTMEISARRSQAFALEMMELAKHDGLTLVEIAMALQAIELQSEEKYGEPWRVAWNFATKVWTQAKKMRP